LKGVVYLRPQTRTLLGRLEGPPGLAQILLGPRQVGKTTAITQIVGALRRRGFRAVVADADALASPPVEWVAQAFREALAAAAEGRPTLLAFDELQKIPRWNEIVKRDLDALERLPAARRPRVVVSGSSALLVERGLTESLAGRFEVIRFPHWGLAEERRLFRADVETHVCLGGYPRLRDFLPDHERYLQYVRDAIVEPVLSRDLLLLHPVDKPVLLRRLFEFACHHPAEIVALQKMLGQLTDRGNVTTIAHYLTLLERAFLVAPLQKFSPEILRVRASSPKLIVLAQALVAGVQGRVPADVVADPALYGRYLENAVGAHLVAAGLEVFYWRDRDLEVDFVVQRRGRAVAVEVGGSPRKRPERAVAAARRLGIPCLVVGPAGVPAERFLGTDPAALLDRMG
jgi:hypothetical protein